MRRIFILVFILGGTLWAQRTDILTDAVRYYEQGLEALEAKRFQDASRLFRDAIVENPTYGEAYIGLAKALLALGNDEGAARQIRAAERYMVDSPDIMLIQAQLAERAQDMQRADDLYTEYAARYPLTGYYAVQRGRLYLQLGDLQSAYQMYLLSRRDPAYHMESSLLLADYYTLRKEYAKAEDIYLDMLATDSHDKQLYLSFGRYYMSIEAWEQAIDILEQGRSLFPPFVEGVPLLVQAYIHQYDTLGARERLLALEQETQNLLPKSTLAIMQASLGVLWEDTDPEKAKDYFYKAIQAQPSNSMFHTSYSRILKQVQGVDSAERLAYAKQVVAVGNADYEAGDWFLFQARMRRAIRLAPLWSEPRWRLIDFYRLRKNYPMYDQELRTLARIETDAKVRDALSDWERTLRTGKVRFYPLHFLQWQGVLLVQGPYVYFSKTLMDAYQTYALQVPELAFNDMRGLPDNFLRGQRLVGNTTSEPVNYYFVVQADVRGMRFSLLDRSGGLIAEKRINMDSSQLGGIEGIGSAHLLAASIRWLLRILPKVAYLRERLPNDTFRTSFPASVDFEPGTELLVFDPKNPEKWLMSLVVTEVKDGVYQATKRSARVLDVDSLIGLPIVRRVDWETSVFQGLNTRYAQEVSLE